MLSNFSLNYGEHWSSWTETSDRNRGPEPYPSWVITDGNAKDRELGIIKTGKEAELYLVERYSEATGSSVLLGAKRYKRQIPGTVYKDVVNGADRSLSRKSGREKRALKKKSQFGKLLAKSSWAQAEFDYLKLFYTHGISVPYPVQLLGTEILMEWIGDRDGVAAPRLGNVDLSFSQWNSAYENLSQMMVEMARLGYAHGDLSEFNILYHQDKLYIIDLPQVVDITKNPLGTDILRRDCINVCEFFTKRNISGLDGEELFSECIAALWC